MTPPAAATAAGRRVTRDAATAYVPRTPRRVSGPVREPETRSEPRRRDRPATRAPARTPRDTTAGRRPATQRRGRAQPAPRLALRLQPPRLDRIVRGRAWIPVLGATLVAIVGLRVEVLKLGSSVGNEVQQATALQSSNSALRAQISALSDNRRIAKLAEAYGMRMPDPLDVHFVQASVGTHVAAAIHNISAPSSSSFLSGLATEQQTSQQSTQAIAAQNGVATLTGTNAAGSTAGTSSTASSANAATSTSAQSSGATAASTGGTTSVTGGTPPATASSGTTAAGTTTAGTTTAGTTAAGTTSAGTTSSGTTAATDSGVTAGTGATSMTATSQTTGSSGSTNGGTGLAG